jgi:hypothetical protein
VLCSRMRLADLCGLPNGECQAFGVQDPVQLILNRSRSVDAITTGSKPMRNALSAIARLGYVLVWIGGISFAQANPAQDRLSAMSEGERQSTFAAFLATSGERCANVTKTFYQGDDSHGNAFWNVACGKANSYVIQINNDSVGSTQILSCRVLEAMKGGHCFKKFSSIQTYRAEV